MIYLYWNLYDLLKLIYRKCIANNCYYTLNVMTILDYLIAFFCQLYYKIDWMSHVYVRGLEVPKILLLINFIFSC